MKTNTLSRLGYRGALIAGASVALFASITMLAYADVMPTVTASINNTNNTQVSTALIGSAVYASAYVSSTSATTPPLGTVTFNRYPNTSCSGVATTQSGVALVNGMASSSQFAVPATGASYSVHYDGQSGIFSQANSSCVSVSPSASATSLSAGLSATSVAVGSTVNETATLAGATANVGGSVSYVVYSNNSCTTAWQGAGVRTVTNATVPASDSILFNNAGTYYWKAVYSGDASNAAATSSCVALSVVSTNTPPVATTTSGTISGMVYNDTNKNEAFNSGEAGIAGFTINLYKGENANNGKTNKTPFKTTTTDGNGNYAFANLVNGTYSVEEINKAGWHQDTADYKKLVIKNGAGLSGKNFANTAAATTTATGGNGNHNGWWKNLPWWNNWSKNK